MWLSSIIFMYFVLPVFLGIYALTKPSGRAAALSAGSLLFTAWASVYGAALMAVSAVAAYVGGIVINNLRDNEKKARLALAAFCAFNGILMLLFSSSLYFGADILPFRNSLFAVFGVSVYALHSISYCADIYRGLYQPEIRFSRVFAYVGFMPCLACGPILKYGELSETLSAPEIKIDLLSDGILLFLCGLAEKSIVANRLSILWNEISSVGSDRVTPVTAWLGAFTFGMWLCFELSGSFHMARGLALMLGFRLEENFTYPLGKYSVRELGRGINLSLSRWLDDHIAAPLGGGKLIAVLAAAAVGGMWYGVNRCVLIWAVFMAAAAAAEKALDKPLSYIPRPIKMAGTLFAVTLGWGFLSGGSMVTGIEWTAAMFGKNSSSAENTSWYFIRTYFPLLIAAAAAMTPLIPFAVKRLSGMKHSFIHAAKPAIIMALMILCTAFMLSEPDLAAFMF